MMMILLIFTKTHKNFTGNIHIEYLTSSNTVYIFILLFCFKHVNINK